MVTKFLKCLLILVLTLSLVFSQVGVISASEDKASLEEYLAEIKATIEENNRTLDDIYNRIDIVNGQIAENTALLESEKQSLESQRASMMKRIQFMYEAGASLDILLAIVSAETISDALNKASYIYEVVSWDREKFDTYVNTLKNIENTQKFLETERNQLVQLKEDFEQKKYESNLALLDVTAKLAEYDVPQEQIQEVMEELIEHEEIQVPDFEEIEQIAEGYEDDDGDYADGNGYDAPNDEPAPERPTEPREPAPTEPSSPEPTTPAATEPATPAEPDEPDEPSVGGGNGPYGFSDDDIFEIARIAYLEDGCVYPEGSYRSVYLVACVIINRALNWYGGSVSAAIFDPGQYATAYKYTNWGGGPLTINDITWTAVYDALYNLDPNPYYQCNGQWLSSMGLTEYYRDPVTDEVFYYPY